MQKLPAVVIQYLGHYLDIEAYWAMRKTNRYLNHALKNPECYYRAWVRHRSTFEPIPDIPYLANFQKVYWMIDLILNAKDSCRISLFESDLAYFIKISKYLSKLVLQTPLLLNKFLKMYEGISIILRFIKAHPSLSHLVFQNHDLIYQFRQLGQKWIYYPFITMINENIDIYNEFLKSDQMLLCVALHPNFYYYTKYHLYLCDCLEKYHADSKLIEIVRNSHGSKERSEIYNLLKSLQPIENRELGTRADNIESLEKSILDTEQAVYWLFRLRPVHYTPRSQFPPKTIIRPTLATRPLPPPPTHAKVVTKDQQKSSDERLRVIQHSIFNQKFQRKISIESNNPLHLAVKNQEVDLTLFLSKNKALNSRNAEGDFPIHLAVITGNVKILEILINMGCLDQPNRQGDTALHLSCKDEKIEMVRLLVQSGASLAIANASNHTPKFIIETSRNLLLREILGDIQLKTII